jgi:hypothetical protein
MPLNAWRMRAGRGDGSDMNPYAIVSSGIGTAEAASLRARLMTWHDAMVAHERRLRGGLTTDACDDECPHVEARTLWADALATLGPRASELTFLRSRALRDSQSSPELVELATAASEAAPTAAPRRATRTRSAPLSKSSMDSSNPSRMATAEL